MKTVLVADDHELVRLTLKKALELSNYRVITAIDGKEAFDILLNHKIDFCVIDLNMPNINGYELIMLMKGNENLKDIPFIVVSALDNKELFNKIAELFNYTAWQCIKEQAIGKRITTTEFSTLYIKYRTQYLSLEDEMMLISVISNSAHF